MFKYRQHNAEPDTNKKIDGFSRAAVGGPKNKADSFKSVSTQNSISPGRNSKKPVEVKTRFINENDLESFPGLEGVFQQKKSNVDLGGNNEAPRKKRRARKKNVLKTFKRLAIASSVFVLLIGGFLAYKGITTARDVFKGDSDGALALNRNIDPSQLTREGDGRVNILILGKGGETHEGGELTDSMTIASIDPFSSKATLLSIPRDLYVDVPGFWSMKINAAYASAKFKKLDEGGTKEEAEAAGAETIEATVEEYMGIPINYYVMIDFLAFEDAVDAVGGVEVDVENRLYDSNFRPTLDVPAGLNDFDGTTALFYVRSRYTSPRGDFDRAQRQREVLLALKDKIISAGTFSNPIKISNLLDSIGNNVRTSMSVDELLAIYDIVKNIPPADITSLSFVDDEVLVTTSYVGDQSVVIPRAGINDYSDIQSFVRRNMPDGFLAKEQATVIVLNGSGKTGGASAMTRVLESYGYNVIKTADAPRKDYLSTILIDNSKDTKPYTNAYLEKRLGVVSADGSSSPELGANQADFIIIIGANEKSI